MVEPVVLLINGSGYRVRRARDAGLADEDDQTLVEYCLSGNLVIVTFDSDLRGKGLRGRCRVLHIKAPERSARDRLAAGMEEVVALFIAGARLVTVRRDGTVDVA